MEMVEVLQRWSFQSWTIYGTPQHSKRDTKNCRGSSPFDRFPWWFPDSLHYASDFPNTLSPITIKHPQLSCISRMIHCKSWGLLNDIRRPLPACLQVSAAAFLLRGTFGSATPKCSRSFESFSLRQNIGALGVSNPQLIGASNSCQVCDTWSFFSLPTFTTTVYSIVWFIPLTSVQNIFQNLSKMF